MKVGAAGRKQSSIVDTLVVRGCTSAHSARGENAEAALLGVSLQQLVIVTLAAYPEGRLPPAV